MTIGDLTIKGTDKGFSGIQWVDMAEEEDFGRLPRISLLGVGDIEANKEDDTEEEEGIAAVFTLSASYLSFP